MKTVQSIINEVIQREAGYVNHPNDKGGETIWGITVAVARAFGYSGPMKEMPQATAYKIYEERYWLQPHFDWIANVQGCQALAIELMDTGVNMGQGTAAKMLQRALNAFNQQGKIYPDIAVDGGVGKMTVACLQAHVAKRGQEGVDVLTRTCDSQQSVRYLEICERDPSQEDFVYGQIRARTGVMA